MDKILTSSALLCGLSKDGLRYEGSSQSIRELSEQYSDPINDPPDLANAHKVEEKLEDSKDDVGVVTERKIEPVDPKSSKEDREEKCHQKLTSWRLLSFDNWSSVSLLNGRDLSDQ